MVHIRKLWAFFAFHLHLFLCGDGKVATINAFQQAFIFLAIGIQYLNVFAYEAYVLLWHLEGLSQSGRSYLQLIVFLISAEVFFYVAAECYTVFNPYSVGVVYFHNNSVVGANLDVYEEVFLVFEPRFNNLFNDVFIYHTFCLGRVVSFSSSCFSYRHTPCEL